MKNLFSAFLIVGTISVFALPDATHAQQKVFRAGAYAQNINPKKYPVSVNGGMRDRQAQGAHDPLHARCLVLDDGRIKIAIAVCDSCMIPREITDEAKRLVQKFTGIPPDRVLISATHTHSAPTVGGVFQSDPNPQYVKLLPKLIAAGIKRAADNLEPAKIGWGVGQNLDQVFNRRWHRKLALIPRDPFGRSTDKVQMNPGYQAKGLVKSAGPIDPDVSVVSVQSAKGRQIALLANYSLHYVGSVQPLSADYFGVFAERMKLLLNAQEAKPAFVGIMSNGTSGDINNINYGAQKPGTREAYEQCRIVANSVADTAFAAFKKIKHRAWVSLDGRMKELQLRVRLPNEQEIARAKDILKRAKGPVLLKREEVYARETVLIAKYPPKVKLLVQALRIGDLAIAANPCETFVEIGLELKKKSPFKHTFTIELANGYNGYLPTPRQHKLGGYETWRARSSYLEENASPVITRTLLGLLNDIAPKKKRQALRSSAARRTAGKAVSPNISHGPMLGRPGAHDMSIWARTDQPGSFRVIFGTNKDFLRKSTKPVATKLENDCTGVIKIKGLKADSRYYYQVIAGLNKVGPGGSFRTLPDAKDYRGKHNPKGLFNFRFEFACGNNQGPHSLGRSVPTFKTMLPRLKDKIQFAILNGDWLYEEDREFSKKQWLAQVKRTEKDAPRIIKLAPTITGVWQNYKSYLQNAKALAAWHRYIPSYYTLDDHEILNDVEGCGEIGFKQRRTVFRDIAIQAWHDYLAWSNPISFKQKAHFGRAKLQTGSDVLEDPEADFTKLDFKQMTNLHIHWGTPDAGVNDVTLDKKKGDPNAGVYKIVKVLGKTKLKIFPTPPKTGSPVYSVGRRNYYKIRVSNCDFYFLDTRSHRRKHDIKKPGRKDMTMLGLQQRDWLIDNVKKSDADFFFIVSSVNFVIPHNGAGGMAFAAADKDDAWTVFLYEREMLINLFDKMKKPVFILTGDLHNSFAVKITDNVWEFASGPHNSRNHPGTSEGNRPATGWYNSKGRKCLIRWSTYFREDVPQTLRHLPVYCVVQVNNVFNNPVIAGQKRWIAYPQPQVVFQYYNGLTGDLLYAEGIRVGE